MSEQEPGISKETPLPLVQTERGSERFNWGKALKEGCITGAFLLTPKIATQLIGNFVPELQHNAIYNALTGDFYLGCVYTYTIVEANLAGYGRKPLQSIFLHRLF